MTEVFPGDYSDRSGSPVSSKTHQEMNGRSRSACLCAATVFFGTLSADLPAQSNPYVLQPRTYTSASGEYSVLIEPGKRRGQGPGTYTLFRNQIEVWSRELSVTLCRASVSNTGFVSGYALSEGRSRVGDIVVMSIDPGGGVVGRLAYPQRHDGKVHGGPEPSVRGLLMLSQDRMLLRVWESGGPEDWWVFRTAPALSRIESHAMGQILRASRPVVIDTGVVRGTGMVVIEWFDISFESSNVRLSLFDPGRMREIWRTDRVARGALESHQPWHFRLVHDDLEEVWLVNGGGAVAVEILASSSPAPCPGEELEEAIPELQLRASRPIQLRAEPFRVGGCAIEGGLLLVQNCSDRKLMAFDYGGDVRYECVPTDASLRDMLRRPVQCTVSNDRSTRLWTGWDRYLRFGPDCESELMSTTARHVMVLPNGDDEWRIRLSRIDLVRAGEDRAILERPDGTWFDHIHAAGVGADGAIAVLEGLDCGVVSVFSPSGRPVAMHRFPCGPYYRYVVPGSGWVAVGSGRDWFVVRHGDGMVKRVRSGDSWLSMAATESGDGLIVVDSNLEWTEYRISE